MYWNIGSDYDAQVLAGLDELRKSSGSVVWVSSGAANKAYTAWSAYGSSKSAMNALSAHLAVEEPDITSIAIAPGRVDTEMQGVLRNTGKDAMDEAQYQTFVDGYQNGELLKPSQPGNVIARLATSPDKQLSGKAMNWNHPDLAAFQDS
jgi:NAD(P)-dependent dehydrogenase (short-subunit alcohol dehydrogenase family)